MFTITGIRHAWPEQAGFCLNRQNGHPDYSFVHFSNKVEINLHGETNVTSDHACIIYRPETPQHIVSHRPLVHDWFHFSGIPEPLLEQLDLPFDTLFYPQNYQFITPLVQEMEREFFAHHVGSRELISARIVELFVLLSRASHSDSVLTTDDSTLERLRSLRSKVFASLDYPWTVAKMASHIPLSESRFYNVYRSFYGTSPMDDLIRARIDSAKNALSFTSQPISAIASSLGYSNATHFSRQFHQFTGMSPKQYRQND
ncbi:MAG: helix-turn-helix transcriptional regulator [Lachnospiraceae bacterium]|nr:helix-turn-helix transcriptional regulator [Lachnospiraceae bacterium]